MSILDALKVQKASQQSITDLAALPQNEIIRLAQMGQIPADVVPVVISEKARMAKEMANLRASQQMQQQGGRMPTVIEQAMQENAQAEAPRQQPGLPGALPAAQAQAPMQMPPQAQPQAAPQGAGVAGLPTGNMFQGQNFQAGGIVAFEEGGDVGRSWPSKEIVRAFANANRDQATGRDIQVLMAGLGMDSGSIGVNLAKMSDGERDKLAQNLVAQYGTQIGDLGVQGQISRSLDAPPGVYGLGAAASYPLGQGRISAGVNAMRTPQGTNTMGYNVGYGGNVGPGQLTAGFNFPKEGRPTGQLAYRIPFQEGGAVGFAGKRSSLVKDEFAGLDEAIARNQASPSTPVMTDEQAAAALQSMTTPTAPGQGPSSLADFIQQYRDITAGARVESPEEIAYREAVKKGTLSKEDIDQQKYMRLLQAGLGIMGGESPYAFTNIGKGSQEALKGYGEDVTAQRAQKMLDLKTAAESARAKRGEELQDIQGGAKLYETHLDRELRMQIAKDSQLGAKYADNYLAMKKAGGDRRPDEVIRDEGYRTFFQEYGFASGRAATQAQIAAGAQAMTGAGITERYANQAQDSVDKTLGKMASPESREYRRLQKEDPPKAAEYRQNLINQRAKELAAAGAAVGGGGGGGTPKPTAAPTGGGQKPDISKIKGAPSGSQVGAFVQGQGWEIRGKDGTLLGYAPVKN